MNIIDDIMSKIDWNLPEETQNVAITMSDSVKDLWYFVQPLNEQGGKNVWDGCARILARRTDKELEPYIVPLFEWLRDSNWPGYDTIMDRMKKYKPEMLINQYSYCIMRAIGKEDDIWLDYLSGVIENPGVLALLSSEYQTLMKEHYKTYLRYA